MTKVATYCYQCVAGPDLLTVEVRDGIARSVEPNFAAAKFGSTDRAMPSRTSTVNRSGPATHW